MFSPKAMYWTSVVLFRRFLFCIISATLIKDHSMQFMAYTYLSICALALQHIVQPFKLMRLNIMESICHLLLMCISLLLLATGSNNNNATSSSYVAVEVFIFLFLIPNALFMLSLICKQQYDIFKMKIYNFKRRLRESNATASGEVRRADTRTVEEVELVDKAELSSLTNGPAKALPSRASIQVPSKPTAAHQHIPQINMNIIEDEESGQ